MVIESKDFSQPELAELATEHLLQGFKNSAGSRAHLQFTEFPAVLRIEKAS
jgi:hypothetical protein